MRDWKFLSIVFILLMNGLMKEGRATDHEGLEGKKEEKTVNSLGYTPLGFLVEEGETDPHSFPIIQGSLHEHFEKKDEEERKKRQLTQKQWEEEKNPKSKNSSAFCCCGDEEDPESQRLMFREEDEETGSPQTCRYKCEKFIDSPCCPLTVIGVAVPVVIGIWILLNYW